MNDPIPVAVVGTGRWGSLHAAKYRALDGVELRAVVDADPGRAREAAGDSGAEILTDPSELVGKVAAASVVVPTTHHHAVASMLLDGGVDVLVEKPITTTLEEADDLIRRAAANERVLQVGHLERFNPCVRAIQDRIQAPVFLEAERLGPFPDRSADVDVVLDLMIHDIDLLLSWVGRPVTFVHAVGVAVLTSNVDISSARLEFEGGAVANVAASRVSVGRSRRMRIFQPTGYLSMDLDEKSITGLERSAADDSFQAAAVDVEDADALRDEIADFVACVRERRTPRVTGEAGRAALEVARRVIEEMAAHQARAEVDAPPAAARPS